MPIFRVKSVKIYTGQKKITQIYSWGSWQISGMFHSTPTATLKTRRKTVKIQINNSNKESMKIIPNIAPQPPLNDIKIYHPASIALKK